jgi:hypothetical protein
MGEDLAGGEARAQGSQARETAGRNAGEGVGRTRHRAWARHAPQEGHLSEACDPPFHRGCRLPGALTSRTGGRRCAVYDGALSPGSFPLAEACSISALISPPTRTKSPLTYIQVSNTITAPMLP